MREIGALFAFAGRQVGKLVQIAFSWATFVAISSVATVLLGFVTVPGGFHGWARLGMLVLAALAVVLVWLMVITPIVRIQAIAKRHDSAHVPITTHPGAYDKVVNDLRTTLTA